MTAAPPRAPRAGEGSPPAAFIPRTLDLPAPLDFEALVTRGIALAQQLSGDEWTDYNEHDPGVTILEALCYAITDLAYRTEHPIADIALGGASDRAEAARRQGIIPGDVALSSAPHTVEDYRRLLYDRVTGVQNAWLLPRHEHGREAREGEVHDERAVYRVLVERIHLPAQADDDPETAERICAKVAAQLHARRSLGEDFEPPEMMPEVVLGLAGTLEIGPEESPEDILAQVQYAVQASLVTPPHVHPTDARLDAGTSPDLVFEGPRMRLGHVVLGDYDTHRAFPSPEEIETAIRGVAGVRRLQHLSLLVRGVDAASDAPPVRLTPSPLGTGWVASDDGSRAPASLVPDGPWIPRIDDWRATDPSGAPRDAADQLLVLRGKVPCVIRPERVVSGLRHLRLRLRQTEQHSATRMREHAYVQLPSARDRMLARYRSIQHFLPPTYGVGPGGVPDTTSWWRADDGAVRAVRREHALQLKSYLLLCEQLLADHLAQLAGVRTLFSFTRDEAPGTAEPGATYLTQSLAHDPPREDDVPDLAMVLEDGPPESADATARSNDRRRREAMLDHLLARFGEAFDNETLSRVIDGDTRHAGATVQRLRRKRVFLEGLTRTDGAALGRDRALGIDYRRGARRPPAGRQPWASETSSSSSSPSTPLLLPERTPIEGRIAALAGHDGPLYVVEHVLLRPRNEAEASTRLVVRAADRAHVVYHAISAEEPEVSLRALYSHLEELELRESLGDRSHWEREWLELRDVNVVLMTLRTGADSLAEARAVVDAVAASYRARPHESPPTVKPPTPVDRFRLSVVYVAPTSQEHEQFLERVARDNTPAHLIPVCIPLEDEEELRHFERLYAAWAAAWHEGEDESIESAGATGPDRAQVRPPTHAQCVAADRAAWVLHEFLVAARYRTRQEWQQTRAWPVR